MTFWPMTLVEMAKLLIGRDDKAVDRACAGPQCTGAVMLLVATMHFFNCHCGDWFAYIFFSVAVVVGLVAAVWLAMGAVLSIYRHPLSFPVETPARVRGGCGRLTTARILAGGEERRREERRDKEGRKRRGDVRGRRMQDYNNDYNNDVGPPAHKVWLAVASFGAPGAACTSAGGSAADFQVIGAMNLLVVYICYIDYGGQRCRLPGAARPRAATAPSTTPARVAFGQMISFVMTAPRCSRSRCATTFRPRRSCICC